MVEYQQVFTAPEAAKYLLMSHSTFVKLLKRGVIPYARTEGGHYRIDQADLDIYTEEYLQKKWASK